MFRISFHDFQFLGNLASQSRLFAINWGAREVNLPTHKSSASVNLSCLSCLFSRYPGDDAAEEGYDEGEGGDGDEGADKDDGKDGEELEKWRRVVICSKFTRCPLSCLGNIYVLEV